MKGLVTEKKKKPKPTSPEKWARAKAKARSKFDVYPSAYANAYASKEYKKMGGGWRMGESIVDLDENMLSTYADMFNLDEAGYDPIEQEKRNFKRREHEAEWEREQELDRQRKEQEGGTWYIRINGKIFKDRNGDPVMFNGKKHANAVAVKMMQKSFNVGKEFILTTKPEDKQQGVAEAQGDTLHDPEYSLPEARRITKAIKYDDTVGEIITQIQMLAERTEGIDSKTLEYSIDGVLSAKNALESAVYGLEEAFEDAARNAQYKRDEEELGEDYTGMFAAEKTPETNPYGGSKDRQFRGAISETPTDNPTGASGEGGWRTYRAKPAGQIDEEQLDELKCWTGYTRVKGVPAGAPGSCKKKTKESSIMKGIVEQEYLDEGLMQKIGGAALAAALALGVGSQANAEPVYVYQDTAGKYQAALSPQEIPSDAVRKLVVDTDDDSVAILKGNSKIPINLAPAMVNNIKKQAGIGAAQTVSQSPQKMTTTNQQNNVDSNQVIFNNLLDQAKNIIGEILVDPDSAKFTGLKIYDTTTRKGDEIYLITGKVNSKNRMGGYSGASDFYIALNKKDNSIIAKDYSSSSSDGGVLHGAFLAGKYKNAMEKGSLVYNNGPVQSQNSSKPAEVKFEGLVI